ncbi:MAG TPA: hypothetical protein PLY87_31500, partial [Planctomycetaceae bacterium]|nr:hypothetical protein [Planctomycetaceae bacterium]
KSVCFDRSSRLTAAKLLKFPGCRIFNLMHLKRIARVVRRCAGRKQKNLTKPPVRGHLFKV